MYRVELDCNVNTGDNGAFVSEPKTIAEVALLLAVTIGRYNNAGGLRHARQHLQ